MKPYKCPVCEGTSNVPKGFYVDEPTRTKCRACLQGIVYGADGESVAVPVPVPMPYPQPYPVFYPVYPPVYPYQPYQPYRPWIVWSTSGVASGQLTNNAGAPGLSVTDVTYSVTATAGAND